MKIEWKKDNNIYLGKVSGELSFDKEEYFLREVYERVKESGKEAVFILDFSGLEFINSSGITVFENVYRFIKAQGAQIRFINLPPKIKEIFFFLNVPFKEAIEV